MMSSQNAKPVRIISHRIIHVFLVIIGDDGHTLETLWEFRADSLIEL